MKSLRELIKKPYVMVCEREGGKNIATKFGKTCDELKLCDVCEQDEPKKCVTDNYSSPLPMLLEVNETVLLINEVNFMANMLNYNSGSKGDLEWYYDRVSKIEQNAIKAVKNSKGSLYENLMQQSRILKNEFLNTDSFKFFACKYIVQHSEDMVCKHIMDTKEEVIKAQYFNKLTEVANEIETKMTAESMKYMQSVLDQVSLAKENIYDEIMKKFENTFKRVKFRLKKHQKRIITLQDQINSEYARQQFRRMKKTINIITGENQKIDKNYTLNIDMSSEKGKLLATKLKDIKFPQIKKLGLWEVPSGNNSDIKELLETAIPYNLKEFVFNYSCDTLINPEYYFKNSLSKLEKVTNLIGIRNCVLSVEFVNKILVHSYNGENVVLWICKILNSEAQFDFRSKRKCRTKVIRLFRTGGEEYSDWVNYPDRFDKFLEAIKQSGLQKSLEEIRIEEGGIDKDQAETIIEKVGLNHIQVLVN